MSCRVFFLIFVLVSVHFRVQSQIHPDSLTVAKVSLINAEEKVEGVYKTFDEFRRNQPSYTGSFEVLPGRVNDNDLYWNEIGNRDDYFDLLVFHDTNDTIKCNKLFGYCRSDTVYLSFWKFHPILQLGHLSLILTNELRYMDVGNLSGYSYRMDLVGRPPIVLHPNNTKRFILWYVLDYRTGEVFKLSDWSLGEEIRKWDRQLHKEFKRSSGKKNIEVRLEVIRKFNKKYPIKY